MNLNKMNSDVIFHYSLCNNERIIIPFEDGKFFFLDTGFCESTLYRDRININSTFEGFSIVNWRRLSQTRRVDSLQIGDLTVKNHCFTFEKSRDTNFENDIAIVGTIGMDILSQKYSYFDIKNQIITLSSEEKAQTRPPSLVLTYKSPTMPPGMPFAAPIMPFVDLHINGNTFENVLFDTGFDGFLALLKKDKTKFDIRQKLTAIRTGYLNNTRRLSAGQFDTVQINGENFSDQMIFFGERTRLLGMKFIKQFSSFSIDPFERKIMFFE